MAVIQTNQFKFYKLIIINQSIVRSFDYNGNENGAQARASIFLIHTFSISIFSNNNLCISFRMVVVVVVVEDFLIFYTQLQLRMAIVINRNGSISFSITLFRLFMFFSHFPFNSFYAFIKRLNDFAVFPKRTFDFTN